jgi:hypothetical protein
MCVLRVNLVGQDATRTRVNDIVRRNVDGRQMYITNIVWPSMCSDLCEALELGIHKFILVVEC